MIFLLLVYAAILVASLVERKYWRALYWLSAIGIMISVLGMGKGK
jgi:hypothetical protein